MDHGDRCAVALTKSITVASRGAEESNLNYFAHTARSEAAMISLGVSLRPKTEDASSAKT
jgi:hypothetical protein